MKSEQAEAWHEVSHEVSDPSLPETFPKSYLRFIALWGALSAWDRDVKKGTNDTQLQQNVISSLAEWHVKGLEDPLYLRKVLDLKKRTPVYDMLGSTRTRRYSVITDETDLGQVIKVIYKVRCNLLHGGKGPMREGRNNKLVHAASQVLDDMVECLLSRDSPTRRHSQEPSS